MKETRFECTETGLIATLDERLIISLRCSASAQRELSSSAEGHNVRAAAAA